MPLSLPAELIPEKNKLDSSGLFLELFELILSEAGITLRLVNNNEDVVWNSNTWSRSQFQSGGFTQAIDGGIESVNIQVSNIHIHSSKTIQGHIEDATINNAIGDFVNYYMINSENLDKGAAISFNFQILNTIAVQEWLTFSLGMKNLFHDRFPLNNYRRNLCRWKVFGGPECRFALSSANTCDRRFITCLGFGHQLRFGAFPGIPKCGGTRINTIGSGTPWIGGGGSGGGGGGGFHVTDPPEPDLNKQLVAVSSSGSNDRAMNSTTGTSWTSQTLADKLFRAVAWSPGLSLFAAVSSDSFIYTSPLGVTWTPRTPDASTVFRGVAWSPTLGMFAIVSSSGSGNRVQTSTNGVDWTAQTSAADNGWWDIEWSSGLGLFAAVSITGSTNRVMTSSNGTTWTSRTTTNKSWRSIIWSPALNLFVAVADGTGDTVMTSPDGITWTPRTAATNNAWRSVAWSPVLGMLAAVSITGTGDRVMTSTDGITWTSRTSAADISWESIVWSSGLALFVAISSDGASRVMTSADGITWSSSSAAAANSWQALAVGLVSA